MLRKNMHLGASRSTFRNAFVLRKKPTEAEEILWQYLRDRQLLGVRFRRQHPMKKYVADFYAHQYKFVIELDGGYHNERSQALYDADREDNLKIDGITILRFTNEEVIYSIETVLNKIRDSIIEFKKIKKK